MSSPDFSTAPRRRPPVADLALVGVSLLAALVSVRAAFSAHAERETARARVTEVRREIEAARGRLRALEGRGGSEEAPVSQALLAMEAPAVSVLAALAGVLPPDVRLDRITLTYGRELALEMSVVARNPHAFDRLLERLDSAPFLRDVRPGAENREGEVRTTVRASWNARP